MRRGLSIKPAVLLASVALALSACAGAEVEQKFPTSNSREDGDDNIYTTQESVLGEGGLFSVGSKKDAPTGPALGVNAFLWRAALDTVSFMPLASADPFGGTIITDWHIPEDNANERFKVNVFLLSRELTANGVRVSVFRQNKVGDAWVDRPTDKDTARQLEDAILTRARQLRIEKLEEE